MPFKDPARRREYDKQRAEAPERQAAIRAAVRKWNATPKGRASQQKRSKKYNAKPEVVLSHRDNQRKFNGTPKGKAIKKRDYVKRRDAILARSKERYRLSPEQVKKYIASRRLRIRERKVILAGRPKPDVCDICHGSGKIVFDHSHKFGHFRGWVCDRCNRTLGFAGDDPLLLMKMASYLLRTAQNASPQLGLPGI